MGLKKSFRPDFGVCTKCEECCAGLNSKLVKGSIFFFLFSKFTGLKTPTNYLIYEAVKKYIVLFHAVPVTSEIPTSTVVFVSLVFPMPPQRVGCRETRQPVELRLQEGLSILNIFLSPH